MSCGIVSQNPIERRRRRCLLAMSMPTAIAFLPPRWLLTHFWSRHLPSFQVLQARGRPTSISLHSSSTSPTHPGEQQQKAPRKPMAQRRRCPTPVLLLLATLSCYCVQGFIPLRPAPVSLSRSRPSHASETLEQEAPTQAFEVDGAYYVRLVRWRPLPASINVPSILTQV